MWQVLGIEQTTDPKLIRRAYAARLRELDPDKDAQGFQRLRQAYEWALAIAARHKSQTVQVQVIAPVAEGALPELGTPIGAAPPLPEAPELEPPPVQIALPELGVLIDPAAPAAPPPEPITQAERDEAKDLAAEIRAALAAQDYRGAFALFDRGLARGVFPIGRRDGVVDGLMRAVLADRDMPASEFLAYMRHVGWDAVPRSRDYVSRVRAQTMERLQAETWLARLTALAAGERMAEDKKAKLSPLQRRLKRGIEWRNARVFFGGHQFWRLTAAGAHDLRKKAQEYRHYAPWLGARIDPANADRADRIVHRQRDWGAVVNTVLIILLAVIFLPLLIGAAMIAGPASMVVVFAMVTAFRYAQRRFARMMAGIENAG